MSTPQSNMNPQAGMNPWGNLFTGVGDLFGASQIGSQNYPNPATGAMGYFNQVPQTISPYYQPYIGAGNNALNQLQGQYGNLLGGGSQLQGAYNNLISNPGAALNQIGQNYHASPGFNFQVNQATNAANNVASAGGMAGSPAEQQSLATTVNGLANQDYYNYLNQAQNLLGTGLQGASNLYGLGLQGTGNLANMGYGASNELAQSLGNTLGAQGQLAYSGQANQNMMNLGNRFAANGLQNSGIGSLGNAFGDWFGGQNSNGSGQDSGFFGGLGNLVSSGLGLLGLV